MSVSPESLQYADQPPESRLLDNGLRVQVLSRPGLAKAVISVRVAAGSHDEPREYPGLAHFLEHLLFLGSAGFTGEQRLMPFVQACGGQLNASTQARHTDYFCEVPADRLEEALARLLDMLARPLFEIEAQWREREVVHAEFVARGADAPTLIGAALGQALLAGHRYGAFQAGNRHSLVVEQADFQQALRDFHRRFYQAGQLTLLLLGPQSPAALLALAEQQAAVLPAGRRQPQSPPAALLPLRAQHLQLQLASGVPSLQLCFALELSEAAQADGLAPALEFLQTWLLSESPGGLLASLRGAGLCQGLAAHSLYRHGRQALLLLSFSAVETTPEARAQIAAALRQWLAFLAGQGAWAGLQDSYRALRQYQLHSLQPLALALYWQDCGGADAVTNLAAVPELLAQMQQAQRLISLAVGAAEQPDWPGSGFALRMGPAAAVGPADVAWAWQLPAANPFLGEQAQPASRLAYPLQRRWLAAPGASAGGQGVLYWRCCFSQPLTARIALAVAQAALQQTQANAAQLGVGLQLSATGDSLQMLLQGPVAVLVRVARQAVPRLLEPGPAAWQQARGELLRAPQSAQMPLRQLLQRLPESLRPLAGQAPLAPEQWQERYRPLRLEVLGVGFAPAEQAAIEAPFSTRAPWPPAAPQARPAAGRVWQRLDCGGEEAALLLFCPQALPDAAGEAGWRVLAHCYQGAFYQRLRTELQLGYGVFCGFRQIQGQAGILFAVQSPHASAQAIVGHIRAFIQAQGERLAGLDEPAIAQAASAVRRQLQADADSLQAFAEQRWQEHLGGLPRSHAAALMQALQGLARPALLHSQRLLSQAEGGWRVLATGAAPAHGWTTLG